MNQSNIINQLAKEKTVENIISNITPPRPDQADSDLAQDIYVNLLEKDELLIEELYSKGEINYFITRMITQNLFSKNSPFYYQYVIPQRRANLITDDNDEPVDEG